MQFRRRLWILVFDLQTLNSPLTTGEHFDFGGSRGRAGFTGSGGSVTWTAGSGAGSK